MRSIWWYSFLLLTEVMFFTSFFYRFVIEGREMHWNNWVGLVVFIACTPAWLAYLVRAIKMYKPDGT